MKKTAGVSKFRLLGVTEDRSLQRRSLKSAPARKFGFGVLSAILAVSGVDVAAPAASAAQARDSDALERVLDAGPFQDAQSLSSFQTPAEDKKQRVEFGEDGSMSIVASQDMTMTVSPVSVMTGKLERRAIGNVQSATVSPNASHSYVFAQRGNDSGAAFVVLNGSTAPRAFSFEITFNGSPAKISIASDGSAVVMNDNSEVLNYVAAPWARDAVGRSIETRYSAEGNRLIQHVKITKDTVFPVVADPQFGWVGIFPVVEFNRQETAISQSAAGVLRVCSRLSAGLPVGLSACAASAVQIALQAAIANARGECIRLAPAPIGAMAFRYTGGYCR
ncbi:hypothetical protein [Arthrobacter sp. M4]|uniref:hypothetical protein n=1 Tax=Arthrobacter sp. M4 TaxID=218160 RepID=UPI001CDC9A74|nr:hypothetical protein [Arthrobacter sp. M4]MCA4134758.1 hypothetical protein [Arthrobacter sp. M4]